MFKFLLLLGLWALTASAQFGFFDHMFHGGGHQQQQQQQTNVRSDSSWYQAQYSNGEFRLLVPTQCNRIAVLICHSAMLALPLPRHPLLRALPSPLSLRMGSQRRQGRTWRGHRDLWIQGRVEGGRVCQEDRAGQEGVVVGYLVGEEQE